MARKLLIRAAVFLGGFGFVAGSVLFALAYFTVDIPDPNAYVNSQSTIIQYSNGEEIGRVGTQNRQIARRASQQRSLASLQQEAVKGREALGVRGLGRGLGGWHGIAAHARQGG